MKKKIFILSLILILLFVPITVVNGDDEIEEMSVSQSEIENIVEATTDASKIPTINSRYAVIYDRVSRKSTIWKRRKCKM